MDKPQGPDTDRREETEHPPRRNRGGAPSGTETDGLRAETGRADDAGDPEAALSWLADRQCRTLAQLVRLPVSAVAEAPESERWIPAVRREVACARWRLSHHPLHHDIENYKEDYENFSMWVDPTVDRPTHVPIPLMTVGDGRLRDELASRDLGSLPGVTRLTILKLRRMGLNSILALADADAVAILRIKGFGRGNLETLRDGLTVAVKHATETVGIRDRNGARGATDADWAAAAPKSDTRALAA